MESASDPSTVRDKEALLRPRLQWRDMDGTEQVFPLGDLEVVLGRGKQTETEIMLDNVYISRRHARILKTEQGYTVAATGLSWARTTSRFSTLRARRTFRRRFARRRRHAWTSPFPIWQRVCRPAYPTSKKSPSSWISSTSGGKPSRRRRPSSRFWNRRSRSATRSGDSSCSAKKTGLNTPRE